MTHALEEDAARSEPAAAQPCARVVLLTADGGSIDVTDAAGDLLYLVRRSAAAPAMPPLGCADTCPPSWAALCVHLNRCTCRHGPGLPSPSGATDPAPLARASATAHDVHGHLTERECEVVEHLRRGFTNKEIARRLGIQEDTVKKHLQAVFGKLGVRRRALVALLDSGTSHAHGAS